MEETRPMEKIDYRGLQETRDNKSSSGQSGIAGKVTYTYFNIATNGQLPRTLVLKT